MYLLSYIEERVFEEKTTSQQTKAPLRNPFDGDWSSCNYHKYKFKTAKKTKGSGYNLGLHNDVGLLDQPALIFTLKGPPALFVVVHQTAQPKNEVHAITEEKYKNFYPTNQLWSKKGNKCSFSSFEVSPGDAVWLESGHQLQHCVFMTEDRASHEEEKKKTKKKKRKEEEEEKKKKKKKKKKEEEEEEEESSERWVVQFYMGDFYEQYKTD
jgi:hypothetical protein